MFGEVKFLIPHYVKKLHFIHYIHIIVWISHSISIIYNFLIFFRCEIIYKVLHFIKSDRIFLFIYTNLKLKTLWTQKRVKWRNRHKKHSQISIIKNSILKNNCISCHVGSRNHKCFKYWIIKIPGKIFFQIRNFTYVVIPNITIGENMPACKCSIIYL